MCTLSRMHSHCVHFYDCCSYQGSHKKGCWICVCMFCQHFGSMLSHVENEPQARSDSVAPTVLIHSLHITMLQLIFIACLPSVRWRSSWLKCLSLSLFAGSDAGRADPGDATGLHRTVSRSEQKWVKPYTLKKHLKYLIEWYLNYFWLWFCKALYCTDLFF